jgi:hypothetical protein
MALVQGAYEDRWSSVETTLFSSVADIRGPRLMVTDGSLSSPFHIHASKQKTGTILSLQPNKKWDHPIPKIEDRTIPSHFILQPNTCS